MKGEEQDYIYIKKSGENTFSMESEVESLIPVSKERKGKESLFCLTTPLEHINFHIIGYWPQAYGYFDIFL